MYVYLCPAERPIEFIFLTISNTNNPGPSLYYLFLYDFNNLLKFSPDL